MTPIMLTALYDASSSFVLQNEQCLLLEISICPTLIGLTVTDLITLFTILFFISLIVSPTALLNTWMKYSRTQLPILDLVLVDTFSLISKLSVEPPVGTSDHNTVVFNVNLTPSAPEGSN